MRDFLIELQSIHEHISENQIGRLEPGLSSYEVVSSLMAIRRKLNSLHRRTEAIIKEHLYPMLEKKADITEADEADLYQTGQNISSYEQRADPGLALKIYQGLLGWARQRGDDAKIIKYLYWCGITLFYLSRDDRKDHLVYFEEGASYADRYHSFENPETRKYIHRCIANTSMTYYFMDLPEKAMEVDEKAFVFWNTLIFSCIDLDFPWLNYFLTCFTHRYAELTKTVHRDPDSETSENLRKILEIAVITNKLYHRNREAFNVHGGTRYDFMLWEAQFLNDLISFDMLHDNISKKKSELRPDDFSPNAMYVNRDLNGYLIFYASTMRRLSDKKNSVVASISADIIKHFSEIPKSVNPREVALQFESIAKDISFAFEPAQQLDFVMKMTTMRHIPTYAHSIIVGKIAVCLTEHLIENSPEAFIGCIGITHTEQIPANAEKLCRLAYKSGLCHDVGKITYITNPYIHARTLTDNEYNLVKRHSTDGKTMLTGADESFELDLYKDVIWGHHKFYDNTGGYPDDFDISIRPHRIYIDIIALADSIEAATDDIIRLYANPKSLDTICEEIISESGTRYSPVAAAALKDASVRDSLADILDSGRKDAYYTAYLHACS